MEFGKDDVKTIAKEVGQQIGEQLGQTLSQTIVKLLQTQGVDAARTVYSEQRNVEDIGETEVTAKELIKESGLRFANEKRTYDEYQNVSLRAIGQDRAHFDQIMSDAQTHNQSLRNAALIALTNAVENANIIAKNTVESANMVGKQAVRHSDLAIDRQWNVDEQGYVVQAILRGDTFKEALAAAVAAAVAEALNRE